MAIHIIVGYLVTGCILAFFAGMYIYRLLRRIRIFWGADSTKKSFRIWNLILTVVLALFCLNVWSTGAMVVVHILALSLVLDILAWIIRKVQNKKEPGKLYTLGQKIYGSGLLPVAMTLILFVYGFFNIGHPIQTHYLVQTDKQLGNYRIALITDTHFGTIQNPKILENKIAEINKQDLDFVVLGGDIVEEKTSKEDMEKAFQILGSIKSRYGIYYVYGNHDRQSYSQKKAYTSEELKNTIEKNGITILEDSYKEINGELILVGRGDAAWGNTSGRASTKEILKHTDKNKYLILADHQPLESRENSKQGIDMQLSGHTHAGQIWPIGIFNEITGLNYGEYQINGCHVIVSSGFAGWGYPVRTEGHSEYVIIELQGKND